MKKKSLAVVICFLISVNLITVVLASNQTFFNFSDPADDLKILDGTSIDDKGHSPVVAENQVADNDVTRFSFQKVGEVYTLEILFKNAWNPDIHLLLIMGKDLRYENEHPIALILSEKMQNSFYVLKDGSDLTLHYLCSTSCGDGKVGDVSVVGNRMQMDTSSTQLSEHLAEINSLISISKVDDTYFAVDVVPNNPLLEDILRFLTDNMLLIILGIVGLVAICVLLNVSRRRRRQRRQMEMMARMSKTMRGGVK